MNERHTRRAFLARSVSMAAGAAALPLLGADLGAGLGARVASAHNVSGNKSRAVELYAAMQTNYYLGLAEGSLYNETSPRGKSNPYAYLWPFYEALAGTVDLYGVGAVGKGDVDDRLAGMSRYYRGAKAGYDSYPRSPYGGGGDRYNDDNAWIGRTLIQLHRMNPTTFKVASEVTPLQGALDVYQFLEASWHTSPPFPAYPKPGGVFWIRSDWDRRPDRDRGAGTTGGFAKVALHLHELVGGDAYLVAAKRAYDWTRVNLYRTDNVYADKILPDGSIDWGVWSYNQGVMIGAGMLLHRRTGDATYLEQAVKTADAAIAYFDRYGWYSQPVIFNSLFFRNLLLLHAVKSDKGYYAAAKKFADQVWDDKNIHNQQKHMIKFDARTSAYKLREQAAMVQLYACLAWADDKKDLINLA